MGNMCTAKWTDLMKLTNLKTAPGRYVLWLLLQNVFESNNKCWCTHYYHYSLCSHPAFWPIQSLQFCSWTIFTDLREIFLTDMIQHTYLQKSYGFIGIYVLVIFFSLRLKRYIGQFYPNHKLYSLKHTSWPFIPGSPHKPAMPSSPFGRNIKEIKKFVLV